MNLGLSTATCHLGSPSPGLEVSTTSFFSSFFLPASFLPPAEAGVLVLLAGVGPLEVCSDWVRLRFSSRKLTISLTSRSSWLQRTEDQQYSDLRPHLSSSSLLTAVLCMSRCSRIFMSVSYSPADLGAVSRISSLDFSTLF